MKFIALNRESTTDGLCLKLAGYIESDWYNEEGLTNKLNESSLIKYQKEDLIFHPIYDNTIQDDIEKLVHIIRMLSAGIFIDPDKEVNSILYKYRNLGGNK